MNRPSSPHCRESPWLLPTEAAAYLGIATGTLRNWTYKHLIPYVKRGRVVRYHRKALDRWLAAGVSENQSKSPQSESPGQSRQPRS